MEVYMFGSYIDRLYGRSPKWRSVRNDFIKTHNVCAACGREDNLEVHHIVPYHVDPSKELDHENLITLCGKKCHFIFGHLWDWKSWNKDVVEDCVSFNSKRTNRPQVIKFAQMPPEKTGYKNAILNTIISYFTWPFNHSFKWNNKQK